LFETDERRRRCEKDDIREEEVVEGEVGEATMKVKEYQVVDDPLVREVKVGRVD
jgi:hypothetical protein